MGIEVHEMARGRADLLDALKVVRDDTTAEIDPEDPPIPLAELEGDLFERTTESYVRSWVGLLDGEPAGEITFELEDAPENAHVAPTVWFAVRPELRRRGVADELLRVCLASLSDAGRTSLALFVPVPVEVATVGGEDYARRLGLEPKLEERCSRMAVADIPDGLIEGWIEAGRTRSDGYTVVRFADRCPDEYLDAYVEATTAMEDIPLDDLDYRVGTTDAALVRSREARWAATNVLATRTLALAPDGSGAGISELFVSRHRPSIGHQGDTGVVGAHRGRGLGRWLKAENLAYARERMAGEGMPGVDFVETYNAQSNPWMLDINVAMGFRPHVIYRAYQGELSAVRSFLT